LLLPSRSDFNPKQVSALLPTLFMFQVWPDRGVSCRVSGTAIVRTLGVEISGKDYLEMTPAHFRAERLRRYTAYVHGMIGRSYRQIDLNSGQSVLVEELALPFGDMREDGSFHVLLQCDGLEPPPEARATNLPRVFDAPVIHELFQV